MSTNHLEGMQCPQCGQADEFYIEAAALFEVTSTEIRIHDAVSWCGESSVECPDCHWTGTIKDLHQAKLKAQAPAAAEPPVIAEPRVPVRLAPPLPSEMVCATCGNELDENGFCPTCDELPF